MKQTAKRKKARAARLKQRENHRHKYSRQVMARMTGKGWYWDLLDRGHEKT